MVWYRFCLVNSVLVIAVLILRLESCSGTESQPMSAEERQELK